MKSALGFLLVMVSVLTFMGIVGGLDSVVEFTFPVWIAFCWFMLFGICSALLGISLLGEQE